MWQGDYSYQHYWKCYVDVFVGVWYCIPNLLPQWAATLQTSKGLANFIGFQMFSIERVLRGYIEMFPGLIFKHSQDSWRKEREKKICCCGNCVWYAMTSIFPYTCLPAPAAAAGPRVMLGQAGWSIDLEMLICTGSLDFRYIKGRDWSQGRSNVRWLKQSPVYTCAFN